LYDAGVGLYETMSWDAVESLDDARAATQSLLVPVSWRAWLRLAVVTFFVGGVGGAGGAGQAAQGAVSSPRPPGTAVADIDLPSLPTVSPESVGAVVLGAAAVLVALVVVHAVVGAIMEFVLVACLRTRRIELHRPFRQFLTPGLRLFVFRTAVVAVLVVLGALPVLVAVDALSVGVAGTLFVPLLVVGVGVAWVVGLAVLRLTTDLVVPTMIAEGRTVLSAWRRLLPLIRSEWREVALFVLIRFGLGVAASFVVGLVVGLAALVVAIPFVLAGGAVAFTVGLQGIGLSVAAGLAVGFVAAVVAVSVLVQVPVVTYFRYYGLFVLGDLDDRLDLVGEPPTRRA
jgi:hypothetical protein